MATPDSRLQTERKPSRNAKRKLVGVPLVALVLAVTALAQNHVQPPPPVAAYGPSYDINVGYSYLSAQIPSAGRVNLNGFDAGGRVGFSPRWSVAADAGYVRTSSVFGTGHVGYVLTLLAGPVFYPLAGRGTRMFVHGLVGAGLVDSALPASGGRYLHGWVERPAYTLGAGMEHSFLGPFGFRLTGDYLRTAYADSSQLIHMQNNLRLTASLVFRLHERSW